MSKSDLTYIITVDSGEWSNKALYLYNSIQESVDNPHIIAFIPEPERENIPEDVKEKIEEGAEIIYGEIPNEDYRLSINHQAFVQASEVSDKEYLLLLDTDMLVLDEIEIHRKSDAELFLKPVDLGGQKLAQPDHRHEWEKISEKTGYPVPEGTVNSTVDKKKILPYWNGGFILTKNHEIPREWLELSKEIHGEISNNFLSEQVALAFLAEKYDVEMLDERYNYPLPHRFGCRKDAKVIHYHAYHFLLRIWKKDIRKKLEKTGILSRLREEPRKKLYKQFIWELIKTLKGRVIGYG